jgi:hypothetical protein
MADFEEIEFVIPAYTPETMPLNRLLEYLRSIGDVIGAPNDLHLVRIGSSSTKPVFSVAIPVAIHTREEAAAVRTGSGTTKQRNAYNQIREMVKKDGGIPATLKDRTGVILNFPPPSEGIDTVSGVRQASSFDGSLIRVGGVGETVPLQMQDLGGELFSNFSAPKAIAKAMAPRLFEPLRVSGIGSWDRSAEGKWKLSKMLIQSFEPLGDETLADVFQKLRAAPVNWPPDADDILRADRESSP